MFDYEPSKYITLSLYTINRQHCKLGPRKYSPPIRKYSPPSIPSSLGSFGTALPLFTMEENEDVTGVILTGLEVCSNPSATGGDSNSLTPISPPTSSDVFVNQLPKGEEFLQYEKSHPYPIFNKKQVQKRRASFGNGKSDSTTKGMHRRSSVVTIAPGFDAGTREDENSEKSSSSAFGPKRLRYKRGSSFTLTPQRSLRRYLTRDVLPHMDNYRHRRSFKKG